MTAIRFALFAFAALAFTACATEGQVDDWTASGEGIETPAIAESSYGIQTNICPGQRMCGGSCTHVDCDGEPGNYFDCRYCASAAASADVAELGAGDEGGEGGDQPVARRAARAER